MVSSGYSDYAGASPQPGGGLPYAAQPGGASPLPPQGYGQPGGVSPVPPQGYFQPGGVSAIPVQGYSPAGVQQVTAGVGHMTIGTAERFYGTIVPANPFNAEQDTQALRKAMKGIGTDEETIINILSKRSNEQRQRLRVMFKTMYGKDLIEDLKSELSGNLEELTLALFMPTSYYDAWTLKNAMEGLGTKDAVLIEILCTRTNQQIKDIVQTYKQHFRRDLEKDIASDTSGHFKRLLISCLQGNRAELTPAQLQQVNQQGPECVIDRNLARSDAQKLYEAGEKQLGTDESQFLAILSLRHYYQMRATFEEYEKISHRDIAKAIGREMSGDLEDGFKAIIECARNRPEFFAGRLHKAMAGMGTSDSTLIRILTSRSEIDLGNIKERYQQRYGKTLFSAVKSETSGDYRKLLLAIIGH